MQQIIEDNIFCGNNGRDISERVSKIIQRQYIKAIQVSSRIDKEAEKNARN